MRKRPYLLTVLTCLTVVAHLNAQTSLLKDINPAGNLDNYDPGLGTSHFYSSVQYLSLGNVMYFTANNGVNGEELWRTDGTTLGTYMVKDIEPGPNGSSPREYTLVNGVVYFTATTADYGRELWRTDGTANGTYLVKDVFPGTISGVAQGVYYGDIPAHLTAMGNNLYFFAHDDASSVQLWKSDGTANGTVQVTTGFNNPLYTSEQKLYAWGNTVIFSLKHDLYGFELWKSDGTPSGTGLLMDIRPNGDGLPRKFAPLGNRLAFVADNGTSGSALWVTNGTTAGTYQVSPSATGLNAGYLYPINGKIVFAAPNPADNKRELWVSDGSAGGTHMLMDINTVNYHGCVMNPAVVLNGHVYFTGNNGNPYSNEELWRTDGTVAGTSMVADLAAYQGNLAWIGSDPENLFTDGNMIYFQGRVDQIHGDELVAVSPSGSGGMVADINPGGGGSFPQPIAVVNGKLLLVANDGVHGYELWTHMSVPPPPTPGAINGALTACVGVTMTYSVSPVTGATSYSWTLPNGWAGSSSSNTISVTVGPSSGAIQVIANNSSGSSSPQTIQVSSLSLPAQPSSIIGGTIICPGNTNTYSISNVSGATSYAWTFSGSGTPSGAGNSATLSPTSSGTLSVTAINACGNGQAQQLAITVVTPTQPVISNMGNYLQSSTSTGNQWYLNGQIISGAAGQTITPTLSGNYTVEYTDQNGCTTISDPVNFNVIVTSIDDDVSGELVIYPNPNNGEFSLYMNRLSEVEQITLHDVAGRSVAMKQAGYGNGRCAIACETISPGFYILSVHLRSPDRIITKNIVIQ